MKFMRVACWVWIVVSTAMILFWAPVSVSRQADKTQVTSIEWIGPFGEPFRSYRQDITKTSIDFSRMIAALLAANFLPAVILWRFKTIGEWLRRHKRKLVISACALVLLFLLWLGGVMLYENAHRVSPTRSSLDKQSSVSSTSPSPANPSPAPPAAQASPSPSQDSIFRPAFSDIPPGYFIVEYPGPGSRIKSKSDDGEIIALEDGSKWRVYPPDRINTASWTRTTYLDVVLSEVAATDDKRKYLLINMTKGAKAYAEWLEGPPPK